MKSILTMAVLSVALGVGAYFVYENMRSPGAAVPPQQVQEQAEPGVATQAAVDAHETEADFNKKFQAVLDSFVKDVQIKASEYKSRRKVVIELVRPQNLGDAAYVQENQQMMDTLIPELKAKMDEIMGVFGAAEANIREAIAAQPQEKQEEILNKWRGVRDEQASHYLAFFSTENEILAAYAEMMQFYRERQGAYSYDESTNSLLFSNPADKPAEQLLRDRIKDMESAQLKAISRADNNEVQDTPSEAAITESSMPVATEP
jgi:hypothetical protein